jgi:very-short-patch-repair endonuclease
MIRTRNAPINETTLRRARQLRGELTDAERKLWNKLRGRRFAGTKFRRQVPIGPYIADFCCVEQRLIVELDGGQHAVAVRQDAERSRYLAKRGWRVIRFWNPEVLRQMDSVLARIDEEIKRGGPRANR